MASDVTMPRLSDSMEEGTVLKWLVDEGAEVERGEELVEIETDKANMTYEADTDGTLIEVVAQEGDTLAIGEVIARIGEPGEAGGGNGKPEAKEEPADEEPADEQPAGEEAADEEGAEEDSDSGDQAGDGEEAAEEPAPAEAKAGTATRERPPAGDGGNGDGGRVKASPVAGQNAPKM